MRLSKAQRETVREKCGGHCAYCGDVLGDRWHVDHVDPVNRVSEWVRGKGFRPTGVQLYPDRHEIGNLLPACPPCNLYKSTCDLETFRMSLEGTIDVLNRNNPTYRHARRFGLITESRKAVKFYFETLTDTTHPPTGEERE